MAFMFFSFWGVCQGFIFWLLGVSWVGFYGLVLFVVQGFVGLFLGSLIDLCFSNT